MTYPAALARWQPAIESAAARHGLDPPLFAGLVLQESGGNESIVSSAGAIGLTQLMPGTAAGLGVNPWVPEENIEGGARYLREQYDRFGDWRLALAAYNAGPGAVERYGGVPPYPETQAYIERVLANAAAIGPSAASGAVIPPPNDDWSLPLGDGTGFPAPIDYASDTVTPQSPVPWVLAAGAVALLLVWLSR